MNKYRILVVDDELLIRDLLYDFFSSQDWDIMVAEGGYKAIEFLKNQDFDIVLTDLKMPDMDGMALAGRIRELYQGLPVVIMTGYPSLDSAIEALRYKIDDYIIKPFNVNQLFKTIKRVVEETNSKIQAGEA
ncbi:MAG: response regulator [candidate division Zixibacteria bacterium]